MHQLQKGSQGVLQLVCDDSDLAEMHFRVLRYGC
jgi:hypothetical protein